MKVLKKTLAALLVLVFLLGVFPSELIPKAGAVNSYYDVNGHWAAGVINRWNNLGFIDPIVFEGTNFWPDQHISRAEFFSLIVNSLGATAKADISNFSDVYADTWEYDIVAIASQMGIANGYPDNTMRPDDTLLRQDAATLTARAMGMNSVSDWNLSRFYDGSFISPYARTYVSALVEQSIMEGYPDSTFRPRAFLTRAEAVKLLDNLFTHIYMPETGLRNVYLQGGVLIQSPGAELRDVIIDGDVIIGDGVGAGNVVIANSEINGRLIVRGGGPNSITLSNTVVGRGMYVASFGANTRIAVTDNSTVPVLESVSSFSLSGSGVAAVTILENARVNAIINLDGVSLDDLNINGPGAQVLLNSGHAMYARFDDAGQGARLDMAANTTVGHLTVSAPGAIVTGAGAIRNLLINNSGAIVTQTPEFLTLGLNIIATVGGKSVSSAESQWANNNIDRVSSSSNLKVQLLANTSGGAPFDQASLYLTMVAGSTAAEGHLNQSAATSIPLTQRNNRWAYWIGFFVPAPPDTANMASVTYTYIDGDPITLPPRPLDTYNGRLGLYIYLPVFREPGRETGMIKELLHINWGGSLTENIHFMSTTMHLATLNNSQKATLQDDFDNMIMYSVQGGTLQYTGAEAVRRILASDNPLGLPSNDIRGLDAINRAVSSTEARSILEDRQFAIDLTIDTTGNSQYSALSSAGKQYVAEQVLIARKTIFANPATVKTAFDKAVQTRLAAETTLLGLINSSADAAALRRIIETAANAAILQFQNGADPYKSYSNSQKDTMTKYLWDLRQYRTIQDVIDAIRKYLGSPASAPGEIDPNELEITKIEAKPNTAPANFAVGAPPFISVLEVTTSTGIMSAADVALLNLDIRWRTNPGSPVASFTRTGNTISFTALKQGNDTLEITHRASGKSCTITISVKAPVTTAPGGLSFKQKEITMRVGEVLNLWDTDRYLNLTPPNATDLAWSSSDTSVVSYNQNGVITALRRSPTPAEISVTATATKQTASINVWVFEDEFDVFAFPLSRTMQIGETFMLEIITASPLAGGRYLDVKADNTNIANVTSGAGPLSRTIRAVGTDRTDGLPGETNIIIQLRDQYGVVLKETFTTVIVQTSKAFEIQLLDAVMEQGSEPQQLGIDDLRDASGALISPPVAGQVFFWESTNPRVAELSMNGSAPQGNLTTTRGVAPEVNAVGIGETTIRLRMGDSRGPVLDEKTIISAPRGVSSMRFYENNSTVAMQFAEGYGRIVKMENLETRPLRAEEPGHPDRPMAWNMYLTDVYQNRKDLDPNLKYTSAGSSLAYNLSSLALSAARMGLYRILLTPSSDFFPDGWRATATDRRGRWYGQTGTNLSFFIPDPTLTYDFIFNGLIDATLSGLKLKDPSGALSPLLDTSIPPNLYDMVLAGYSICDVNGETLVTAGKLNLVGVPLVLKTADVDGSNEIFVWVRPRPPEISMYPSYSQLTLSEYNSLRTNYSGDVAMQYLFTDDFIYQQIPYDDPPGTTHTDLDNQLMLTAWTEINFGSREIAGTAGLTTGRFGRTWGKMPDVTLGSLDFMDLVFRVEVRYTTNRGFASYLDPLDEGELDPPQNIGFSHPNNPGTFTLRIVKDPPALETVVSVYENDSGPDFLNLEGVVTAVALAGIVPAPPLSFSSSIPGFFTINATTGAYTASWPDTDPTMNQQDVTVSISQGTKVVNITVQIYRAYELVELGSSMTTLITTDSVIKAAQRGGVTLNANTVFESSNASIFTVAPAAPDPTHASTAMAYGVSAGYADLTIRNSTDMTKVAKVRVHVLPSASVPIFPLMIDIGDMGGFSGISGINAQIDSMSTAEPTITELRLRSTAFVAIGKTTSLEPYVTPYDADRWLLTWSTSDTAVATVYGGIVTGIKAGTAIITVTDGSGLYKAECTVTVRADARPVTAIAVSSRTLSLNVGATWSLSVTYRPSNATIKGITWVSSDSAVARVEPNGKVVSVAPGTATITAISDSGGKTATCIVTVKIPVESLTLPETSISLHIGETYQVTPVIYPTDATVTTATYSTSSATIAAVTATGVITARRAGTATITVRVDGKSVSMRVTVVR